MSAELAGRLDQRVTLEAPEDTPDGAGGYQRAWKAAATLWANVAPAAQGRADQAARLAHPARFDLTLRPHAGISAGRRFRWNGRTLVIEAVTHMPRASRIACRCVEETGA